MSVSGTFKLIRKLEQKKYRKQTGLFVVEGKKNIQELLSSNFKIETIIATENVAKEMDLPADVDLIIVTYEEISRLSRLKTPQPILALVRHKDWNINGQEAQQGLVLALDNIQDPGNMGTILRLANWFGIKLVVASTDTVDVYNPKVVQASMGAVFHTPVVYGSLEQYFFQCKAPIYGTFLEGESLAQAKLTANGVIVMGNEAHGIRSELNEYITRKLFIPSFGMRHHVESLNVAMATSIVLWEFAKVVANT